MGKQQFVELRLDQETASWLYRTLHSLPPGTKSRDVIKTFMDAEYARIEKQGGWDVSRHEPL